jgi:hypothetical protein
MKRTNLRKTLIPAALLGAALVGTNAQADPIDVDEVVSKSYYLAQDNVTNRCIVVDIKPTPVGVPSLAYESRALAERAIAEASVYDILDCSNTATAAGDRDSATALSTDGRNRGTAMSANSRDGETAQAMVTAQSSDSEQRVIAPTAEPVTGGGKSAVRR